VATHLTWTRKSYWRARGPDGEYVAKESGSTNFATPEELWEGIANSPLRGEFDVEPARFRVSKGYGVLSPDTGDTSPPTVPTGLSGSPLSASSIFLGWAASTDNVGVTEYQVYRNGVPIDITQDTNYTDSGLTPSTQYSYQVSASDAAGNSSGLTSAVQVTTSANSAPSWSTSAQSLTIGVAYSLALSSVCSDVDGHALTFTQVSGTLPAGLTFSNGVVSGTPTTAQAPSVTFRASDGYTTTDQVITFTVTQADTTPPDVPTGLAVGTPASNSLPLSWDANPSGQGLAGYKLYRSTNGVNYGLHQTIAAGTTTYNDGSLNADTTYYYKLSAFDNATPVANESAQSAAVSGRTAVASTLTWSGNPFPMTVPAGSYVDLEQYISDPANELGSVISIGTALPSGVTIVSSSTWRVTASAGATLGTTSGHQLYLLKSADADWLSRSTASGVFYSTNFTYKDAAKTQLITNVTDLAASAYQTGSTAKLAWDTSLKLSGNGCLRLNMAGGSIDGTGTGWTFSFDGIGLHTKNTSKTQFYIQFAYYADSVQNNFNYGGTSNYGGKIIIVEAPDTSFDSGEVVFRRWVEPGGFVAAYSLPVNQSYYNNVISQSRGLLNNLYDANHYGASFGAPSTASQWKQRHGYMSIGTVSDPDYVNAPRIISNTWMTIEIYVDLVNDCVKMWMAPYGESPKLIIGKNPGNGDLPAVGTVDGSGSNPKPIYTGAQLTNYANSPTAWPSTSTYVCYDEVIASNDPIPFPGGYTLPFPGTDTVTSWPWTGTVFRG